MLNHKVDFWARGVLKAKCSRHLRYDPATDGLGGVIGNCAECMALYQDWCLFRELKGRFELFLAMPHFKRYQRFGKKRKEESATETQRHGDDHA